MNSDTSDSDDWEKEYDQEIAKQEIQKQKHVQVKPKIHEKKLTSFVENSPPIEKTPDLTTEKERAIKAVEKSEVSLVNDLFEGCERTDEFQSSEQLPKFSEEKTKLYTLKHVEEFNLGLTEIKSVKDCNNLITKLLSIIKESKVRPALWYDFMIKLFTACAPIMTNNDLKTFSGKVSKVSNKICAEREIHAQSKRKVTEGLNSEASFSDSEYSDDDQSNYRQETFSNADPCNEYIND